jgi:hypothetical protein
MKIIFSGDVFLGGDLNHKAVENLINVKEFHEADLRIVNFESPIGDVQDSLVEKSTLHVSDYAIEQLKDLKIDVIGLANNHIHDLGQNGILSTIKLLESQGFNIFGAGKNINNLKNPFWINDKYALFGYCDFEKKYLKDVQIAGKNNAGVAPLRIDDILFDLNSLKNGQKAILFFHWGQEHVSLPPHEDVMIAKKLLKDDRVLGIIGMHAHRVQGRINVNEKKAWMCIGNFLFPNFYMKPPVQICYSKNISKNIPIIKQYHEVLSLTYKKWKRVNRISILIQLEIKDNKLFWKEIPVIQNEDYPKIYKLKGFNLLFFHIKFKFLNFLMILPFYNIISKLNSILRVFIWRLGIINYKIKLLGMIKTLKYILKKIQ